MYKDDSKLFDTLLVVQSYLFIYIFIFSIIKNVFLNTTYYQQMRKNFLVNVDYIPYVSNIEKTIVKFNERK